MTEVPGRTIAEIHNKNGIGNNSRVAPPPIPAHCLHVVLRDAFAGPVYDPEVVLRRGVALVGRTSRTKTRMTTTASTGPTSQTSLRGEGRKRVDS